MADFTRWRDARFGMFIHWGPYSAAAGVWNGTEYPGNAEWIMHTARIPVKEYKAVLPQQLDLKSFDAAALVSLAKAAGMRYMVITTKHHDGFAMYDSKCSDYCITHYCDRDPLRELADECKKQNMMLGFYYSQAQDWEHPDGIGNDWDFDVKSKHFERYMNEKCLPQLTELLTGYGDVGLVWFDTPMNIAREHSEVIAEHVRKIAPNCLVSGRIGFNLADYASMGDNMIPRLPVDMDWETPATLNRSWGFRRSDNNWKTAQNIIGKLVDINGRGGNYLLNVGPDAHGSIPERSREILLEVGEWMQRNGESVHGTVAAPVTRYEMENVKLTRSRNKLYVHFTNYNKSHEEMMNWFSILLMKLNPVAAYVLGREEEKLEVKCDHSPFRQGEPWHMVSVRMPKDFIPVRDVICIEFTGDIEIEPFGKA